MNRVIAAAVVAGGLALAAPAVAQTWGQPYYGGAYASPPLSETDARSYVQTGDFADGYNNGYGGPVVPYGYGGGYGGAYAGYGYSAYGYGQAYGYDRGGRYGYSRSHNYSGRAQAGYRDRYGYNDDRPPSRYGRQTYERRGYRDCGCERDVYLYDR